MEGNLQHSLKLDYPVESDDMKYVSKLSTILVATIQEAKERISQIEYIFCSQLYSNFQSKSKSLQKIYLEAIREAENSWKEKENDLLLQIEKLQLEKQEALDENQRLKLEKEKSLVELDGKINPLLSTERNQQNRIDELEYEVRKKSKEVDEGLELQKRLLQMVQTKSTMIVDLKKQLIEYEEKTNRLLANVQKLEEKIEEIEAELKHKTEKISIKKEGFKDLCNPLEKKMYELAENAESITQHEKEKKELVANVKKLEEKVKELEMELRRKTEKLARKKEDVQDLINRLWQLGEDVESITRHEKEKKELVYKLECLEDNVSKLQKNLKKKTEENEEGKEVQEQLLQEVDMNNQEILKQKQLLEESENEKKLLLEKLSGLEEKINELQGNLSKVAEEKDSSEKLLQQIELKDSQLLSEKKKREHLFDAYKRLKSQYNYLCTKSGLTEENMLLQNKLEDESGLLEHQQNPTNSPDFEDNCRDTSGAACEIKKVKIENELGDGLEDVKMVKSIPVSSFHSPSNHIAPRCPPSAKSAPVVGTKRPASRWIDTRSGQCRDGSDPHDDFLNTPLENHRGTISKAVNEKFHDLHIPVQKDLHPDSSDDETQDMNVDPGSEKQQMPLPMTGQKGFKYVEPVRKKAERDNLKGVECKLCKKFYDAVLPNGGKDADGNEHNSRCEHHDGVSRHRYKYIPPMTPEGFWNIGFESEM